MTIIKIPNQREKEEGYSLENSHDKTRCFICNTIDNRDFHDVSFESEDEEYHYLDKNYNVCRGDCCDELNVIINLLSSIKNGLDERSIVVNFKGENIRGINLTEKKIKDFLDKMVYLNMIERNFISKLN